MLEKKQNYSIPQTARILGITKQCLYNLVEDDHVLAKMMSVENGNILQIDRSEILRLLKRKKNGERFRKYLKEIDRS